MGLVTWIALAVIVLVIIGLGAGVFFSGLLKGAQIVAQNPVVQNATHEALKTAENIHITTTPAATTTTGNTVTIVQSEKTRYRTTEPVVIVIKNNGSDNVVLPGSSLTLKVKNQITDKIYDVVITQAKAEMKSGESISVAWDQRDNAGSAVGPGAYAVDVEAPGSIQTNTNNTISLGQATFTIQN
jgi:flagellar hook assembly protein FlgD